MVLTINRKNHQTNKLWMIGFEYIDITLILHGKATLAQDIVIKLI